MNDPGRTARPNDHVSDLAELYALGTLDAREAERVNAHAAGCAGCAQRLGEAEATVTGLDDAVVAPFAAPAGLAARIAAIERRSARPVRDSRMAPSFLRLGSIAAAFALIVTLAAGTRAIVHLHAVNAQDDAALAVIATSHFKHATLTKLDPAAPTAKILWGLGNRWIYLIVDSPQCECRIVVTTASGRRDLGPPLERGRSAVLFANDLPPVRGVELQEEGRARERATLPL